MLYLNPVQWDRRYGMVATPKVTATREVEQASTEEDWLLEFYVLATSMIISGRYRLVAVRSCGIFYSAPLEED